jgi:hypothetical protein
MLSFFSSCAKRCFCCCYWCYSNVADPSGEALYFCGNSLGLLPRRTQTYLQEELHKWAHQGVEGHFRGICGGQWILFMVYTFNEQSRVTRGSREFISFVCLCLCAWWLIISARRRPAMGQY